MTTRLGLVLALGLALGATEQDAFLKAWSGIRGDAIAKHIAVERALVRGIGHARRVWLARRWGGYTGDQAGE